MKFIRLIVYGIILLLACEVVKVAVAKTQAYWSFYVGTIMLALQLFIVLALLFVPIIRWLMPKRWPSGSRWAAACGAFLTLMVLMELIFCWWLRHPQNMPTALLRPFRYYYEQYDRNIVQYDDRLASYDPALFYKLIPGVHGQFGNAEFNTSIQANSLGLRDDESSLQKPAVICLGDSYAMGWGVEVGEAYPSQLEQLSGMQVLNGAMSSYGTAREMIRLGQLDTTALRYLVIQYCFNDFEENTEMLLHGGRLPISSSARYDSLTRLQSWNARYFPGKVFLTVTQAFLKMKINEVRPTFALREPAEDSNLAEQAAGFLRVLDAQKIDYSRLKVLVVLVDDPKYRDNPYARELQRLLQTSPYRARFTGGIAVINMLDRLTAQDYYILDPHLKPSGHRKIAEAVWEQIK